MTRDPGILLAATHALPSGERVRLRLTRPSDLSLVEGFLGGLSPATRHLRFFTAAPGVPSQLVRHFTFYDPRERIVIAATLLADGYPRIVGLGDVAVLETGLAELGLVVDDDRQGQGIGSLVCEALAWLAAQRGSTHVKAQMLEHNDAMARLMERLGTTVRTVEDGHPVVYARLDGLRARAA
ncbi:MAG: GNAT family protein [Thermoleophilaceae bacterium]